MFDPTKGPGQLTKKDCWISATVIGIYMALGEIPNIIINDKKVIIDKRIEIILISKPNSNLEASVRALRVYFAKDCNLCQSNMTSEKLEHYGSPDIISELLLRKTFTKYCCHQYCLSRVFYPYLCSDDIRTLLISKTSRDVILCTFNFNPSHLYVVMELKSEADVVSVIDVSTPDLMMREIKLEYVNILMHLNINEIMLYG